MDRTLHGGCACGRNHYIVEIPQSSTQLATILFDNSRRNRHHQATPFTAFLRVPLSWYHSTATSFFPDEPLSLIRRTFHEPEPDPPSASRRSSLSLPGLRRQFCGYCGTPLTAWHERTPEDAEFISLTLGSLSEEDVGGLEELGVFGAEEEEREEGEEEGRLEGGEEERGRRELQQGVQTQTQTPPTTSAAATLPSRFDRSLFGPLQVTHTRGAPWFESLVEDSRLGRIRRRRGGYTSEDGTVREEWEVVEWGTDVDDGGEGATGKRKIAQVIGEDVDM